VNRFSGQGWGEDKIRRKMREKEKEGNANTSPHHINPPPWPLPSQPAASQPFKLKSDPSSQSLIY